MRYLFFFLAISCGKNIKPCLTSEQIIIKCIAKEIDANPNPWQLEAQESQCRFRFPKGYCYLESDL